MRQLVSIFIYLLLLLVLWNLNKPVVYTLIVAWQDLLSAWLVKKLNTEMFDTTTANPTHLLLGLSVVNYP